MFKIVCRRNEGGRVPVCHRVSVNFMHIFLWVKATVKITAVKGSNSF
jgi:hypothetical protein